MALNIPQIEGPTMPNEAEKWSAQALQNLCFRFVYPCRLLSIAVYPRR